MALINKLEDLPYDIVIEVVYAYLPHPLDLDYGLVSNVMMPLMHPFFASPGLVRFVWREILRKDLLRARWDRVVRAYNANTMTNDLVKLPVDVIENIDIHMLPLKHDHVEGVFDQMVLWFTSYGAKAHKVLPALKSVRVHATSHYAYARRASIFQGLYLNHQSHQGPHHAGLRALMTWLHARGTYSVDVSAGAKSALGDCGGRRLGLWVYFEDGHRIRVELIECLLT